MAGRLDADLDETSWRRLDAAVARLEDSWRQAVPADLAKLVPPAADPLNNPALVELIKIDQECRWQSGQPKPLEAYLEEWPELYDWAEQLVELLSSECLTRAALGSPPTRAEIDSRFPTIAARIDLAAIVADADSGCCGERPGILRPPVNTPQPTLDKTPSAGRLETPLSVGRRFGRYEIRELLGEGGMGAVYRAFDTRLEREVALKVPRLDSATDQAVVERFLREGKAAARVRHPHVCPVFDTGEIEGTYFLTMALIEGRSLAQWRKTAR